LEEQHKIGQDDKQPTSESRRSDRVHIIDTVQTPLGFFVLIVLVVEVILGIVTTMSAGNDRTYLIVGMLGLIFLLALIVPLMAVYFPGTLYGKEQPSEDRSTARGDRSTAREVSRLPALNNSKWQVKLDQVEGPDGGPYEQTLRVTLHVEGDAIRGNFTDIDAGRGLRDAFLICGRLYFERFLQLDCHPRKPGIVQFSTWILEWHDGATILNGRFVGYGHVTSKIIHGTVTLTKLA
jgi:hypothetical protein